VQASQLQSTMPDESGEPDGQRLLIVGNPNPIHVGAHFFNAARAANLSVRLCDTNVAYASSWPVNKFNWWLRNKRPSRLESFSAQVVEMCRQFQPHWLLSTGISPVQRHALEQIGHLGVKRLNFLTDDPWNPGHNTSWFMGALSTYDHVFSPRRANLQQLSQLGCKQVSYLPFGYAPELHFGEPPEGSEEERLFACDVAFAGGADPDRVDHIKALISNRFNVALYGGYWNRFRETAPSARGHADPRTIRKAIGGAKVALCLVRRANRDGHAMRSFEVPAIGACMLVEDTLEHREIFGQDGQTVVYFRTAGEMVDKTRWLLENKEERERLAQASHEAVVRNGNTYRDRLTDLLLAATNPQDGGAYQSGVEPPHSKGSAALLPETCR
jgi:hypothetical protein